MFSRGCNLYLVPNETINQNCAFSSSRYIYFIHTSCIKARLSWNWSWHGPWGEFKCNQPMAHQYAAAAAAAISQLWQQTGGDGGGIYWCMLFLLELIIQDPLTLRKGQMKFSPIKWSFFAWLISVGGAHTHTHAQLLNISRFSLALA